MSKKERFNPHDRAARNIHILRAWLDETALDAVPLNQFGASSKQKICKQLGISPSTISTNNELRRLFDELDEKITGAVPKNSRPSSASSSGVGREQPSEINQLIAQLTGRSEELERRLRVLAYLEDSGWDVRP